MRPSISRRLCTSSPMRCSAAPAGGSRSSSPEVSGTPRYSRTTTPTLCCTYGCASSATVCTNTSVLPSCAGSPPRVLPAGAGAAAVTCSRSGAVRSLPTRNDGISIVPVPRGVSATPNSDLAVTWPLTICICRLLTSSLSANCTRSGAYSGAASPWSVSMLRVTLSPAPMLSRSSHARVAAAAGSASADSSSPAHRVSMTERIRVADTPPHQRRCLRSIMVLPAAYVRVRA